MDFLLVGLGFVRLNNRCQANVTYCENETYLTSFLNNRCQANITYCENETYLTSFSSDSVLCTHREYGLVAGRLEAALNRASHAEEPRIPP